MTRDSLQEFDRNPNLDTDIAGINTAPGWSPSSVGPAFRQMMSQLANYSIPLIITVSGGVTATDAQASGTLLNTQGTGGTLTVPARISWGWVWNSCTGNVVITTGTGVTRTVPPGLTAFWFCYDGVNIASPTFDVNLGTLPSLAVSGAITAASLGVTGSIIAGGNIQGNSLSAVTNIFANGQISSAGGGSVGVIPAAGTSGGAYLSPGGVNPGFVAFTNAAGTRVGYVGYTDGGANHVLQPEGGYTGWVCAGNYQVNGAMRTIGQSMVDGVTYFGTNAQFFAGPNWGNPGVSLLNFASNQYIIFQPGVGFDFVSGGRFNFSNAIQQGGVQVCLNNGGTWNINITGSAGFANSAGHASSADTAANATHAGTADFANSSNVSGATNAVAWGNVSGVPDQIHSLNQYVNTNSPVVHDRIYCPGGGDSQGISYAYSNIGPFPSGGPVGCGGHFDNWVAAAGFGAQSDRRLKSDIQDLKPDEAIAWVNAARPRQYTKDAKLEYGFVAQEDLESVRAVSIISYPDGDPRFAEADGNVPPGHRLHKDYNQEIAPLVAVCQALLARVQSLEEQLAALRAITK